MMTNSVLIQRSCFSTDAAKCSDSEIRHLSSLKYPPGILITDHNIILKKQGIKPSTSTPVIHYPTDRATPKGLDLCNLFDSHLYYLGCRSTQYTLTNCLELQIKHKILSLHSSVLTIGLLRMIKYNK